MRALLIGLLLLVAFSCQAQLTEQVYRGSSDSGYVTTVKKKIMFTGTYQKIIRAIVDHDTTAYARTPLLYYALENDTANSQRSFLRPGDAIYMDGLGITHIYIWASSGTVPYRVIIYR